MADLIQNIDYNIQGYYKKNTIDSKGDLTIVEYYRNYDGTTYSNLKVRETRVYTRDGITGLLTKRDMTIEWFKSGEVVYTKTTEKYYSAMDGFNDNKRSRTNLVNKASMYLYMALMTSNPATGAAFCDDYENLTSASVAKYVNANIQPLLDMITKSTEVAEPEYREYITAEIKNTLLYILNIIYTA